MNTTTPNITLCPCDSGLIHAHGFDPATGTLALQFKSKGGPGSIYYYANCTQDMYDELCAAESIGKFFAQRIKNANEHPFTKIETHKGT